MKIQIIGAGVVGQATGKGFARLGHEVSFLDLKQDVLEELKAQGFRAAMDPVKEEQHVYFICTPEANVEEAIQSLQGYAIYRDTPIVIRSTVPPGTAKRLSKKYDWTVISNPEFLREGVSEYEFLNPPAILLGIDRWDSMVQSLYEPFRRPIYITDTVTAELIKLAINAYLACQISYWNQVKLLAEKLGVNSHVVGMLASGLDPRVSTYGSRMHGKPFGGHCLPKDIRQLIDMTLSEGVSATLFQAIEEINK